MWRKASKSTPAFSKRGSGTRLRFTQKPAALFGLPREGPAGVSGRGRGCTSYGWGWSRSRGADKEPASKRAGGRAGGPDTEGRKGLRAFQSPRVGPGGEAGGQSRRLALADPAAAQRATATQENKGEEPDAGAALVPPGTFCWEETNLTQGRQNPRPEKARDVDAAHCPTPSILRSPLPLSFYTHCSYGLKQLPDSPPSWWMLERPLAELCATSLSLQCLAYLSRAAASSAWQWSVPTLLSH